MGNFYNSRGRSKIRGMEIFKLNNTPNDEIPLISYDIKRENIKKIMQSIVKFGITKAGISSTLYTEVRYGNHSLGGIRIFDPFVIQGTYRIDFLIKHNLKSN